VDEAISTFDIHKGAKISQAGDTTGADITNTQIIQQTVFERFTGFVNCLSFRKDQPPAIAVNFDNLNSDRFTHHLTPALIRGVTTCIHPADQADLGCWHKTTQPSNADNQTTFIVARNGTIKGVLTFQQLFRLIPVHLFARARV